MKKNISIILALLLIVGISYFLTQNLAPTITLYCPFKKGDFTLPYYLIATSHIIEGIVLGILFSIIFTAKNIDNLSAYKRKCEKLSVQSDTDDTKLKALETKIQTLEIALQNALKKNN
ncbi:MAG: hypothetical protein PHV37_06555 [Candidatus Gastranaerophilales bacterium]|nr:hypothetical protein [Candidatus Gastranaerophilales bacterium]